MQVFNSPIDGTVTTHWPRAIDGLCRRAPSHTGDIHKGPVGRPGVPEGPVGRPGVPEGPVGRPGVPEGPVGRPEVPGRRWGTHPTHVGDLASLPQAKPLGQNKQLSLWPPLYP